MLLTEWRSLRKPILTVIRARWVYRFLCFSQSGILRYGFTYALSFTDDCVFGEQKSDIVAATERFLADVAPYGNVNDRELDNGTEYKEFQSLCVRKHEQSASYLPHQRERVWRSLFEMTRYLLLDAKLPKDLWTYAVMIAA